MELYEIIEKEIRQGIEDVLSGEDEVRFDFGSTSLVEEIAEELGLIRIDMDISGWEGCFSVSMEKDGVEYNIYGNGYYGGVRFERLED